VRSSHCCSSGGVEKSGVESPGVKDLAFSILLDNDGPAGYLSFLGPEAGPLAALKIVVPKAPWSAAA